MASATRESVVEAVLRRYPKSHADELTIDVGKNTPSVLYQWLIVSLLFSARIAADQAQKAAHALFEQGWRTAEKMSHTSWDDRVQVLNRSGYARYDESTSRYIGDTTELLLERYDGDLRKLRDAAEKNPASERELLKDFKGVGDVGADIFCREAQRAWQELYPFADEKALRAADRLNLPDSAEKLAQLVSHADFPTLLAGLVRVDLADEFSTIRADAA